MPMFVRVRWMGASNESAVVENCHFCFMLFLYIFRNFTFEIKIIMSEYGFSSTSKQMTLNDLE